MKKLMIMAIASIFVGSFALAADEESSVEKDRSHNVVTGTDKETTVVKKKGKDASGAHREMKHKKTIKHKTDGTKETSEDKDESTTPAE